MELIRWTIKFLIVLVSLTMLAMVLWLCLFYRGQKKEPGGTLVDSRYVVLQQEVAA